MENSRNKREEASAVGNFTLGMVLNSFLPDITHHVSAVFFLFTLIAQTVERGVYILPLFYFFTLTAKR
jgi:hypothetical protein